MELTYKTGKIALITQEIINKFCENAVDAFCAKGFDEVFDSDNITLEETTPEGILIQAEIYVKCTYLKHTSATYLQPPEIEIKFSAEIEELNVYDEEGEFVSHEFDENAELITYHTRN